MFEISNLRRVAGKSVVGEDGERIGKVVDVYESTDGGGGTFATVATGLFGSGSSFFPLDAAHLDGDDVVVPYTKEFIKAAPRVDHDEDLTSAEEQRLFEYYGLMGAPSTPPGAPATSDDGSMTRSEERLHVSTEQVEVGRARLRKYVVTETVTRTVPVTHDELRITREPVTAADLDPATASRPLSDERYEVVLSAERPVVEKEVVPVERVRLDTFTVSGSETVTETLRKEQVELVEGEAAAGLPPVASAPGTAPAPAAAPYDQEQVTTTIDVEPRH